MISFACSTSVKAAGGCQSSASSAGKVFQVIEERRAVEFVAARIGLSASEDESLAGAGAGDVTVKPFVAEPMSGRWRRVWAPWSWACRARVR